MPSISQEDVDKAAAELSVDAKGRQEAEARFKEWGVEATDDHVRMYLALKTLKGKQGGRCSARDFKAYKPHN